MRKNKKIGKLMLKNKKHQHCNNHGIGSYKGVKK